MESPKVKAVKPTHFTIDARPSGVSLGRAELSALFVRLIRAGQSERQGSISSIDTIEADSVLSQSDTQPRKIA